MPTLTSRNHTTITVGDAQHEATTYDLPIAIGDDADQIPQALADKLLAIAGGNADEYAVIEDEQPPDPPKEDPPKEEPPKEDPPKASGPSKPPKAPKE